MTTKESKAVWEGTVKEGKGTMEVGHGAYNGPYSFASRFENGKGTNPEELIAAAHAGCFSMALSSQLTKAGYTPKRIESKARVHLEKEDGSFAITRVELTAEAEIPDIDEDEFQEIAEDAKDNCVVSKALAGVEIDLEATLSS